MEAPLNSLLALNVRVWEKSVQELGKVYDKLFPLPPPHPRHPRRILLFLSVLGQSNLVSGAPRNVEREPAARVSARVERGRTVEKTSGRRPGRGPVAPLFTRSKCRNMQKSCRRQSLSFVRDFLVKCL